MADPALAHPWPSPRQELMLTAALRRGESALAAWEIWVRGLDAGRLEEQLEPDSQWLMPLLYRNLHREVAHPVLARCRNVYLHNWYKNNALLHGLASWLQGAGSIVPQLVLLKGAAVALRYYDAVGARPIETIDAWIPDATRGGPSSLGHPPGSLTLHESPFPGGLAGDVASRAESLTFMGATGSVLSPADQLVHICVHRQSWDSRTRLIWVADAVRVIRTSPGLDWDGVLALATRMGRRAALSTALDYLGRFDVGAPAPAHASETITPPSGNRSN